MIRKDLKHIQLENQQEQDHTGISDAGVKHNRVRFAEGIELKQTYTSKDIENLKHLDFGQALRKFTWTVQLCVRRPWTRQYGVSTAEERK
jgi:methylmalonyl-CoA mutase